MFEKNLEMGFLLDFYGQTLPERKRAVMSMYYNEDLSLAEISDEIGISRQGVRGLIKKTETGLIALEASLGLAARFISLREKAQKVERLLESPDIDPALRAAALELIEAVKQ